MTVPLRACLAFNGDGSSSAPRGTITGGALARRPCALTVLWEGVPSALACRVGISGIISPSIRVLVQGAQMIDLTGMVEVVLHQHRDDPARLFPLSQFVIRGRSSSASSPKAAMLSRNWC